MFQHWIPKSYLESWTDPQCPDGYTPFVWLFDFATLTSNARGPKKILGQKHYYTQPGARDPLYLEKALQKIESAFVPILRTKIEPRIPLSSLEMAHVLTFAAAMKARTKVQLDHLSSQFAGVLEVGRDLEAALSNMTDEERRAYRPPPSIIGKAENTLRLEQVEQMVEAPAHAFLKPMFFALLQEFGRMGFTILCTNDLVGFITSDAPCVVADARGAVTSGLNSPGLQVHLPLSPRRCLFLTREPNLHGRYVDIDTGDGALDAINRITCAHAGTALVSRSSAIRSEWLR